MEFINELESDVCRKNMRTRSSNMIVPKKRVKYLKDVGYSDTPSTESDSLGGTPDTADPSSNCIPHLSDPQNSIKELLTSDNPTTDSPQDSGELVFRPAIETPDSAETNQAESSNGDSIMDASETFTPESCDCSTVLDTKRTRRSSKRKKEIDEHCPVCGITVRVPELKTHYAQEIEKLSNISKRFRKPSRNYDGINNTYVQVKSNRSNRLTAKIAQYAAKAQKEIQCPICKIRLSGSVDEVNDHVALCMDTDDLVNVDDDDDSSFEEYEIGDEIRIRAISLVPGGYRSLQGQSAHRTREDDLDMDVEVDVDDTMAYGQPQELDVISNRAEGIDETYEQLRKAVLVDPTAQPRVLESRKWGNNTGEGEGKEVETSVNQLGSKQDENDDSAIEEKGNSPSDQVISSLKEKIKDLEDQTKNVKCLICLEPYTKPVVSTTCWHVHCEECWLMTMGMKKLCPQCNMIVFPSDLRKIFL